MGCCLSSEALYKIVREPVKIELIGTLLLIYLLTEINLTQTIIYFILIDMFFSFLYWGKSEKKKKID